MSDRREFLMAGLSGLAVPLLAASGAEAASTTRPVVERDTPGVNLEGWRLVATEVTLAPGEESRRHQHPGFVIGYVLAGQYRFAVNDRAPVVLSRGEMFFESFDAPDEIHTVSANPSRTEPATILAIVFTKKGDPVTVPRQQGALP
jgi:quercetin dioxygenase-like cupin family protein